MNNLTCQQTQINELPHKEIRKSISEEDLILNYKTKTQRKPFHDIRSQLLKENFQNFSPKNSKTTKTVKTKKPQKSSKTQKMKNKKNEKKLPRSFFTNIRSYMTDNKIFDSNMYYNDVSFEYDENFKRETRGRKQNWSWLTEHQKEDQTSKHYKILGIAKTSSLEEIKKQYYKLSMKYHPDRNPDNLEATEKFQKFSESYHAIIDQFSKK
eukprot:gene10769-3388_t